AEGAERRGRSRRALRALEARLDALGAVRGRDRAREAAVAGDVSGDALHGLPALAGAALDDDLHAAVGDAADVSGDLDLVAVDPRDPPRRTGLLLPHAGPHLRHTPHPHH